MRFRRELGDRTHPATMARACRSWGQRAVPTFGVRATKDWWFTLETTRAFAESERGSGGESAHCPFAVAYSQRRIGMPYLWPASESRGSQESDGFR